MPAIECKSSCSCIIYSCTIVDILLDFVLSHEVAATATNKATIGTMTRNSDLAGYDSFQIRFRTPEPTAGGVFVQTSR
jgi:hypothetical protein